jgi:hypothetical protein
MDTGTQTRSYEEVIDALAEALQALEHTLDGLSEEDWARPTLLRTVDPRPRPGASSSWLRTSTSSWASS